METQYPKTHSYLMRFAPLLRSRAAFRRYFKADDPCWSMFNIGQYTLAPWKVIWQRMGRHMRAVVCGMVGGKPVIPQETLCLVAVSKRTEAHYLCAVLNSLPFEFAVRSYSQEGGKSFASPHILKYLNVPEFSAAAAVGEELAELSELAHNAAAQDQTLEVLGIEKEISLRSARLWGISATELSDMEGFLERT